MPYISVASVPYVRYPRETQQFQVMFAGLGLARRCRPGNRPKWPRTEFHMLQAAIQSLVFLLAPALVLGLCRRSRVLAALSPIFICYVVGIVYGNLVPVDDGAADVVYSGSVILAIPLLLFTVDLRAWVRLARPTIVSCLLAFASVLTVSIATALAFRGRVPDHSKIAGVLVGTYTGGTANMAAIAKAIQLDPQRYVQVNAIDIALGGLFFLFLISAGFRIAGRWLPPFRQPLGVADGRDLTSPGAFRWREGLLALAWAVVIALASGAFAWLVPVEQSMAAILGVTTLGLLASTVPHIRRLTGGYHVGQYLLLVFAVAIASLARFGELARSGGWLCLYITLILYGSILVHFAFCVVFRIDRDTAVITSTAAIFSPAFVGPVVAVLGNPQMMVSGVTSGMVGFAVGTYAGVAMHGLLVWLAGV